jgi:hypothetical protein
MENYNSLYMKFITVSLISLYSHLLCNCVNHTHTKLWTYVFYVSVILYLSWQWKQSRILRRIFWTKGEKVIGEASSKEKLKSNGDKTSPCFRPFWIGNASNCITIDFVWTYVINLKIFIDMRNSMRIYYNVSLFIESYLVHLKIYN